MAYAVLQTRRFARQYRRLNDNVAADVDRAVIEVAKAPKSGERKKGDLENLRVHKFLSQGQLYLLGYSVDDGICLAYLEAIGPHENFYRDLKHK